MTTKVTAQVEAHSSAPPVSINFPDSTEPGIPVEHSIYSETAPEKHASRWTDLLEAEANERPMTLDERLSFAEEKQKKAEQWKAKQAERNHQFKLTMWGMNLDSACAGLERTETALQEMAPDDLAALQAQLYRVHQSCGRMLEKLEALAGRQWEPQALSVNSLSLLSLGGYRVDPKTGQKMCPFSHYREPIPNQDN